MQVMIQRVLWVLIVATLVAGAHRLIYCPPPECGLKVDHPTRIYSQMMREKSGRLHKVTCGLFSEEDRANRLIEPP